MRYLFITICLFLFFTSTNLNCTVEILDTNDKILNQNKAIQELAKDNNDLKEIFHDQEVKIAELGAARDAYTSNIQFFSLLITVLIVLTGYFTIRGYKKQIKKFKNEYTKFKNEIDPIIMDTVETVYKMSTSNAGRYLSGNKYIEYLIEITTGIKNGMKLINIIDYSESVGYKSYWIKVMKININELITNHESYETEIKEQMNVVFKKEILIEQIEIILTLDKGEFHEEHEKIVKLLKEIKEIEIKESNTIENN